MVVDEVRKPLGLVRDDGQEAAAQIFGEDDVIAREGLGGAADRCDRSSQLMGDSGNEIRLELLQPPLLRPIAKRVDGPVRKAHSGDREPEVPVLRSGHEASPQEQWMQPGRSQW